MVRTIYRAIVLSIKVTNHILIFAAFEFFKVKNYNIDINRMYYISAAVTVLITILIVVSFIAITRLLVFHIKLGKCKNDSNLSYLFFLTQLYPSSYYSHDENDHY